VKCPDCGNDYNSEDKFCGVCGVKVPQTKQDNINSEAHVTQEKSPSEKTKKISPRLKIGLIAGLLAFLVGTILLTRLLSADQISPASVGSGDGRASLDAPENELDQEIQDEISSAAPDISQNDSISSVDVDGDKPQGTSVTFNETTFILTVGGSVEAETIPSSLEAFPYWGLPEHDQFIINGYPVKNDIHEPIIRFFPVDIYRAASEEADQMITALEQLLRERPADLGVDLPFLPAWNAGSLGTAKAAYLDFQSGSGLRYITQYGQNSWPFYNQGMFYTYQGLTADGRFYISAILPLTHKTLDQYDNYQPPDNFYDIVDQLIRDQIAVLNSELGNSFTPAIDELDAMMQSILVESQSGG